MGDIVKRAAYLTRDDESIGCAKFVVFANVPEDNPFMAGAFHGVGEGEAVVSVGVSGPGVVASAIKRAGDCDFSTLADIIKKTAFKITRVGQLVALKPQNVLAYPSVSSTCPSLLPRLSVTPWRTSSKTWDLNAAVHTAQPPLSHSLTMLSKKAA